MTVIAWKQATDAMEMINEFVNMDDRNGDEQWSCQIGAVLICNMDDRTIVITLIPEPCWTSELKLQFNWPGPLVLLNNSLTHEWHQKQSTPTLVWH